MESAPPPRRETEPQPPPQGAGLEALLPGDMARKAEDIGVKKASMDALSMFALATLAGAFIALGAVFSTTALSGSMAITDDLGAVAFRTALPYGWSRVLGGLAFCLGLILVVVAGAELFTGNNLIAMAWASGRVSTARLLRGWAIVYAGNFAGAVGTAGLMFLTRQYTFGKGAVGLTVLTIANDKCKLDLAQAVALGVMCNALVCLAVWLCYSARTTTDKILSILFPITAFVAAGLEHSVANMYFIPMGLLVKAAAPPELWTSIGKSPADFGDLTWTAFFLKNLLPVTVGNIAGGSVMVGLVYWFIYLRKKPQGGAV